MYYVWEQEKYGKFPILLNILLLFYREQFGLSFFWNIIELCYQ